MRFDNEILELRIRLAHQWEASDLNDNDKMKILRKCVLFCFARLFVMQLHFAENHDTLLKRKACTDTGRLGKMTNGLVHTLHYLIHLFSPLTHIHPCSASIFSPLVLVGLWWQGGKQNEAS